MFEVFSSQSFNEIIFEKIFELTALQSHGAVLSIVGKPLKIHVTDQQSSHPVMEDNLSQGTDPHK